MNLYPSKFNERLAKARRDADYTQKQVSEILKISRSTLANYESGLREPDLDTLAKLADFYSVSVDWLLGTKGKNKIND